jgi:NAD dependent epimerase/dehydratase family enzyme
MIVPWIHVDDLCRLLIYLSKHPELQGPFNAVAPNVASNAELTKLIAKNLNKPAFLPPVPGFVLKLMMGEMGQMLLSDQNISAEKICANGFGFNYLYAKDAIGQLLKT